MSNYLGYIRYFKKFFPYHAYSMAPDKALCSPESAYIFLIFP